MSKRSLESNDNTPNKKSREICNFKEKCFRKNPHHFMQYEHPHLDILLEQDDINVPSGYLDKSIVLEQIKILKDIKKPSKELWKDFKQGPSNVTNTSTPAKNFAAKLKCNAPYNLFFTLIPDSPQTKNQNNSIQITDLLCPSLGNLKCSLQINFMIDIMWLMEQYAHTGNERKPLTMLYGEDFPNMKEYMAKCLPNVTPHFVKMQDPFGTHHSKMGIYAYTDGSIRVVISTANLYYEDWNIYCQGVWVSPKCPLLPADKPDSDGSGPTDFKCSLQTYLKSYNIPCLNEWIERVKRADFSDVKVFFVASMPGKHQPRSAGCHLQRVGDLLSRHCSLPDNNAPSGDGALSWSVIAQSSSLGNFGQTPAAWLRSALLRTLASHKKQPLPGSSNAKLCLIFPTVQNVLGSYKGPEGGGCLPYGKKTHERQRWLESYLHEWKADRSHRTRAMPHIKSYCRVSPCHTRLAYFLLTSANISKAAWGTLNKTDSCSYVRSYEVGVLFLPSFFDEPYFSIDDKQITKGNLFPFMYDLPLSPYKTSDTPWCQ